MPVLPQRNCASCPPLVSIFRLSIIEALWVANIIPQHTENIVLSSDNQYECNNFLMMKHTCKQQVPWSRVIIFHS